MTSVVSNMDSVELAATSAKYVQVFPFKIIIKEYDVLLILLATPFKAFVKEKMKLSIMKK